MQNGRSLPATTNPITTRTRARTRANTNPYALLTEDDDNEPIGKDTHNDMSNATTHSTPLALPVFDPDTGQLLEHRQLRKHPKYKQVWDTSYANELGRLCQGIGKHNTDPTQKCVEGTNTFRPIKYHDIPLDRRIDVTYTKVVCEIRPQKEDPNRTRITIGGNRICNPGDTGTSTGSLELVKLQINSVLSTIDARFACFNISNFYLGMPLDQQDNPVLVKSSFPVFTKNPHNGQYISEQKQLDFIIKTICLYTWLKRTTRKCSCSKHGKYFRKQQ